MVKQLTFFWSQKGGVKELGGQSIRKDLFIKQIMPDKYVALGFCERDFLLSPKHGAQRQKHIDLTNSLNQPCLVDLKICSKCPYKIGGYFDQQGQT